MLFAGSEMERTGFLDVMDGGSRYMLWWSVRDGTGGVRIMVKEICEKLVEVKRVSGRVMAFMFDFEEDVLRLICGCALQSGRSLGENQFLW